MVEWALLVLKIAGLVGVFAGLSGEAPPARQSRKRTWALFFLAMAIGAELVDSLLKRQESKEEAVRFERLAHPLGTIQVTPSYSFSLDGEDLKGYRSRVEANETVLSPDIKTEPAALALFTGVDQPPACNVEHGRMQQPPDPHREMPVRSWSAFGAS
jgi:hypothetical protein